MTPSGQPKSPIPSPYGDTYTYAAVEFDIEQKIGKVHPIFYTKQESETRHHPEPLWTMHQCNPKVWVIKRRGQVCAALDQWKGIAKLTLAAGDLQR